MTVAAVEAGRPVGCQWGYKEKNKEHGLPSLQRQTLRGQRLPPAALSASRSSRHHGGRRRWHQDQDPPCAGQSSGASRVNSSIVLDVYEVKLLHL